MADTRVASGLTVQQWDDTFFLEYFDEVDFSDIMGDNENAIIQVKENLTKKKGDSVTFAFLNRLTNAATTGSDVLEGKEEDMTSRSHKVTIAKRRHGVRVSESDEQFSAIGLRDAMKPQLKNWSMEKTIIGAMGSIDGVAYATATAAQRNAWLVNNTDRVLFGAANANTVAGDHASSVLNIDAVNDTLTRAAVSLMKRKATLASPKIRPVRDPGDRKRYYIMYVHPYAHRDLRTNLEALSANSTASNGAESARLFEGGDLYWDGVIVKELLDMPVYAGVGAAGIDVAPAYLLGAQAIGYAIARRWKTVTKEFDYGDKFGTAIDGLDGFAKLRFGTDANSDTGNTKDNGVCTGLFAAVGD
jgi:N4-gp56 family major capsid protein